MIPEEWECKQIGEVAAFINGKAHEKDISNQGKYIVVNSKFISTEGAIRKHSDQCYCEAIVGDVLMVMSDVPNGRAIAKCFLVDRNHLYAVNQRICIIRPRQVAGRLLFYKLNRNSYYLSFDDGVKQTNLRKIDVSSCQIAFPNTKTEQHAIADSLGDVDALLVALDSAIEKQRDLKQATMQQLFTGETRLPGFEGKWQEMYFAELCRTIHQRSPISSGDGLEEGGYPLFVSGGQQKRINKALFINVEALVFSDGGMFDVKWYRGDFSVTDHCLVVELDGNMPFYREWMQLNRRALDLQTFKGTGLRNLDKPSLAKVRVPCPSPEEQAAIACVLADFNNEIDTLQCRRAKTAALKQAMMQSLLTGRIRLV